MSVKTPIRNNVQDKNEIDRTNELLVRTPISESTIRSEVDWKSIGCGSLIYDKIVSPTTEFLKYIAKDSTFTIFNKITKSGS